MAFTKIRRFFVIDIEKLRATKQGLPLFVDIIMVVLVIINLNLIFFDWSYNFPSFQRLIAFISPQFNQFYRDKIHPNASFLDLIFVTIFILEILIRWSISIYKSQYDKWFFYPIVNWYDVLGCIPMNSTFKLFRLFRIVGMLLRLNYLGIIDLKSTYIYKKVSKYIKVFVEEISDNVVLNVINGVQKEVGEGNPILHKIAEQVLIPKKKEIDEWLNQQLSESISLTYYKYRDELYQYLKTVVNKSVYENPEIKRITLIPGIGKQIATALDSSISNITFNVVDNAVEDMSKNKKIPAVEDVTSHLISSFAEVAESKGELSNLMKGLVGDSLELVKQQVAVKQWRVNELTLDIQKLQKRIAEHKGDKILQQERIEVLKREIERLQHLDIKRKVEDNNPDLKI